VYLLSKLKGNIFDKADNMLGKIVLVMAILSGIGVFAMAVMSSASVIMRYYFRMPVAWAIEWSEYLIFINVMLAAPWVLKIDKHVRVDVFTQLLPLKGQRYLNQFISVLGVIMCSMFFYYSLQVAMADVASGVTMVRIIPIPRWVIVMFIPFMSFMAILVFINKIIVMARHKDMMVDADYIAFEEAKMNPKYRSSTFSTPSLEPQKNGATNQPGERGQA